jgi:hypothetical protein
MLKKHPSFKLILFLLLFPVMGYPQTDAKSTDTPSSLTSLLLPGIIAVAGYLVKSLYDVILERQKRKTTLLEEKLKNFYWPILTRIEENTAIFKLLLDKDNRKDAIKRNIANYVERHVILKNHEEIMAIIVKNRYLAKFDEELSDQLREYIRHVSIYKSILESKEDIFPADIGAAYPVKFNDIIKSRTEELQKTLDKKRI